MWTSALMLITVKMCVCLPHYDATQTVSRVTSSIQRHYFSNCIIILQVQGNTGLEDIHRLIETQKSLAETCNSQVSILNFKTLEGLLNSSQHCSRPLHVIDMSREWIPLTSEILVGSTATKARWLLFIPDNSTIQEILGEVNIPPDCEFLVAQIRDAELQLKEAYRVKDSYPLEIHKIGNWTRVKGVQWRNTSIYKRRNNFHGLALRTTVSEKALMTNIIREDNSIKEVRGLFGDIWSALGHRINMTNKFQDESEWGMKTTNGSWDGLIGRLVRGEADTALADFHMSAERLEVVDFLYTLKTTAVVLFMQQPENMELNGTIYFAPFKLQLWIAMMAAVLLIAFFLSVSFYMAYRYAKTEQRHYSIWDSLFSVFACFFAQGYGTTPNSWSCLSVFLTAYWTGVVLLAAYSGALVSFLAVQTQVEVPIRGFQGLLNDGSYRMGVTPGSAVDLFRESSNHVMQKLYKRELEPSLKTLPKNSQEGFSRVCSDPKYTFLESILYYTVMKSQSFMPCDVTQVPDTHKRESVAIAVRKGSPYTRFINHNLLEMSSTGIISKLKNMYEVRSSQTDGVPIYRVRLEAVLPLIINMTIAIFLSTVCLFVELGVQRLLYRRRSTESSYHNLDPVI